VVEHETDIAEIAGHPRRGGQLGGTDQQVETETRGSGGAQSAAHLGPVQPAGIWLILDQVPQAGQPVTARQAAQPGDLRGDIRSGQVSPADDGGDQVAAAGQRQELLRLGGVIENLNEDTGADPLRRGGVGEVVQAETPPQCGEVREPLMPAASTIINCPGWRPG
jgi:hypothetical protein